MSWWLSWAQAEAFTLLGQKVTWAELIGNACALATVWLAIRRTIWTWPVQLTGNVLLFAVLVNAHLGGNAARQVMFAVLSGYGWWRWSRGMRGGDDLPVRHASTKERLALAGLLVGGTAAMAAVLHHFDASWSPVPDAYIFVGSAVATLAQGWALIEFWWIWVAVDAVGVPLAARSGLWVTAGVYGVFFVLCLIGYRDWRARSAARAGMRLEETEAAAA
ncbi:Nicotinamide mononucleotide transporter PnuC [Carbonactinospora thermoautotrophica]|uniref:Nicotinamide mononucleotide transporter PnuC n=1 Tax=Carbonactinospora thermoautotrophica TaxID=1469144 RepID=A0A132MSE4_9ACTN|nr:nicotinamide mononucleotide transporter family protein [Carbonactinospora thermoautotrophica]KWX00739.1 Nicotinamide mononucleotide transporter PnuC [Carbonactinospora thermoautotrophica]